MHPQPIPANPYASVADIALAQAAAGRSASRSLNQSFPTASPVAPAPIAGPQTAYPVALFKMTGRVTGRFKFGFDLVFTDSAADAFSSSVSVFTGVTSVTGGTVSSDGFFTWASSAITVTGGAAQSVPAVWSASLPAGGLSQTAVLDGVAIAPTATTPIWLIFNVAATHNLSAMSLNAYCYEI